MKLVQAHCSASIVAVIPDPRAARSLRSRSNGRRISSVKASRQTRALRDARPVPPRFFARCSCSHAGIDHVRSRCVTRRARSTCLACQASKTAFRSRCARPGGTLQTCVSEAFCPNIQPRAHARLTGLTIAWRCYDVAHWPIFKF